MLSFGSYGGEFPDLLGWDTWSGFPDSQSLFTMGAYNPVQRPGGSGPTAAEQLTALANQTESQLQMNLSAFQADAKSAASAASDAWSLLNGMVGRMLQAGDIGRRSAAERDRRIDPARLRWDWIAYYIDPIPGAGTASGAAAVPSPVAGGGGVVIGGGAPGPVFSGGFGGGFGAPGDRTLIYLVGAVLLIWVLKD